MRTQIWRAIILSLALSQNSFGQVVSTAKQNLFPLYIEVRLENSVKLSSLRPGDVTEGKLARDVYSGNRKVFVAGSSVRLTVNHLDRQRRAVNDHWPWVVRVFVPRHRNSPAFGEADIWTSNWGERRLQVSLISAESKRAIYPRTKKRHGEEGNPTLTNAGRPLSGPILALSAREKGNPVLGNSESVLGSSARSITVPAGTACRVLLLNRVSASKSRPGDIVQARLLEPVVVGEDAALPAGSLFEGIVLKARPPRSLSRAGSLSITFTRIILPDGAWFPVAASLNRVEVSRGSRMRIDDEGRLRGDRPGRAWMLINGGVTAGIAKEADDGAQLVLEAILSGATDASTAGTARIAGTIVSGVFMLTRHGRDVVLPDFTDMDITLTRPLTLFVENARGE